MVGVHVIICRSIYAFITGPRPPLVTSGLTPHPRTEETPPAIFPDTGVTFRTCLHGGSRISCRAPPGPTHCVDTRDFQDNSAAEIPHGNGNGGVGKPWWNYNHTDGYLQYYNFCPCPRSDICDNDCVIPFSDTASLVTRETK